MFNPPITLLNRAPFGLAGISLFIPSAPFPPKARGRRGFTSIIAIEGAEGDVFVPFGVDDFRYLGEGRNPASDVSDPEKLLAVAARPERGSPDPEMSDAWRKKPVSEQARSASEWVRCGPGTEWLHYAAVIRPEMIRSSNPADAAP